MLIISKTITEKEQFQVNFGPLGFYRPWISDFFFIFRIPAAILNFAVN